MNDTPTTATAAMRELLPQYPRPWKASIDNRNDGTVLVSIRDANNQMINRHYPDVIEFICAAVNATGTGEQHACVTAACLEQEEQRKSINRLIDHNKVIAAERDELRSALAAAREQHKAMMKTLDEVWKHDAEAYRYFMANDNVGGIFSYGLLHSALATLAPSQPTPDAEEKPIHSDAINRCRKLAERWAEDGKESEIVLACSRLLMSAITGVRHAGEKENQ